MKYSVSQSPSFCCRQLSFAGRSTFLLLWGYGERKSFRFYSSVKCHAAMGWHHGVVRR